MLVTGFFKDTNTGSAFNVLGRSGVITVNGSLDRETKSSYSLRVGVSTNLKYI